MIHLRRVLEYSSLERVQGNKVGRHVTPRPVRQISAAPRLLTPSLLPKRKAAPPLPTPTLPLHTASQHRHHVCRLRSEAGLQACHGVELVQRSGRPLPGRQEDRRGQLWRHLRRHQPAQQHPGRDQIRAPEERRSPAARRVPHVQDISRLP